MKPNFLVPEQVVRQDGFGPVLELGADKPNALSLTFGITSVLEQESIELTIHASADGENFDEKPVFSFPQKFYCGTYSLGCDLSSLSDARFLRASWKVKRWGRGEPTPLFSIYVFAEPVSHLTMAAAG